MSNYKSLILLSGGLDSLVSLAVTKSDYNIQLALTFDYGQRAAANEINASRIICEYFNINHQVIKLPWLSEITQTSLVNKNSDIPSIKTCELDNISKAAETAKNVWVPNRNGVFLNIAASYADSYDYTHILFGANKEEGTTFPDNTPEFIQEINNSFEYSTLVKPKVYAPLISLTKCEIVQLAKDIEAPTDLVKSCYKNEDKHCGSCESCLRLRRAIEAVYQNDSPIEFLN